MRTVLETIQSSSNGAACGIIAEDRPRCVCANTVACPVWLSQLSGLPPLKLLQVEPDVAQQHPLYRAHDRNWFFLVDAPQPRIFVEFDLDIDYCTSSSVSVAQPDISNAWSREKLRHVEDSCRPLYFYPFVAFTGAACLRKIICALQSQFR